MMPWRLCVHTLEWDKPQGPQSWGLPPCPECTAGSPTTSSGRRPKKSPACLHSGRRTATTQKHPRALSFCFRTPSLKGPCSTRANSWGSPQAEVACGKGNPHIESLPAFHGEEGPNPGPSSILSSNGKGNLRSSCKGPTPGTQARLTGNYIQDLSDTLNQDTTDVIDDIPNCGWKTNFFPTSMEHSGR